MHHSDLVKVTGASAAQQVDVLVVLASFRAEGTPRMTLDLCWWWTAWGLRVAVVDLHRGTDDLRGEFEALGLPIFVHPVGHRGYRRYPSLASSIWRICRQLRPSAVLSMPMGLHAFIAIGAKLAGVARIVAHVGNPPLPNPTRPGALRKFRWETQMGRPFTYRLICCSRYVQEATVRNLGVHHAETEVVYNGVHIEPFEAAGAKSGSRLRNEKPVIGMVGTLEGHKDQATLIRAAAALQERGYAVETRLIGEGPRRAELEKLIRDLNAPVYLLGSRADVPEQVADLDVFVFSTTDQEGLGIALIEAMAAGVPVVASDVPACREVLDDGALGVLVPQGDSDALADGIEKVLLHNPDTAARRAEASRVKVIHEFSAETMARQYAIVLGLNPSRSKAPLYSSPEI